MSDEERTSAHEGEDGTDDAQEEGQGVRSRYNLRQRMTVREQERSHQSSPLFPSMIQGRLNDQSAELIANLRKTLADTERLLSTPRMSVANALDGGQHRKTRDSQQEDAIGDDALEKDARKSRNTDSRVQEHSREVRNCHDEKNRRRSDDDDAGSGCASHRRKSKERSQRDQSGSSHALRTEKRTEKDKQKNCTEERLKEKKHVHRGRNGSPSASLSSRSSS